MAASDTRHTITWGRRLRFLVRSVGITGVLAAVVGSGLFASAFPNANDWTNRTLHDAADGMHGDFARTAAWTFTVGLAAVAFALIVEVIGGIVLVAGRRTAANTSATVGVIAATALLVFVNAYSFTHHVRLDTTRARSFTLPDELAAKLRKLRPESPTTIVVLQKHRIFGTLSDERDSFTKAAEEKVTEKVKDLVDLFREFGPRFHVEVLDTEAFGYRHRLGELTKDSPELKAAIESAPENSILFHANGRVQRLAFNEFLQLDKTASEAANGGRGNLVLLPQGIDRFARRVLAVQERRPKVAVCVVHEWLSTTDAAGQGDFSTAGLKRSLVESGFDVIDIILKKNWEDPGKELEPAAYTINESKLERLEAELDAARNQLRAVQRDAALITNRVAALKEIGAKPATDREDFYNELITIAQLRGWTELMKTFRQWLGQGRPITDANEAELREALATGLSRQSIRAEQEVKDAEKARAEADDKAREATQDERSLESRRLADVKAKFAGALKDVDLVVIPRYTLVNATLSRGINPGLHTLSKTQVEVLKDFMKQGKPILACLGSLSGPNGLDAEGMDDFDRLMAERGIELGRDTVLYDSEAKSFAAIRGGRQLGDGSSDIPPLQFVDSNPNLPNAKPNPVGSAVRLTGRSVDQKLDLRMHAPRPVYISREVQEKLSYAAEFVFTSPDSWNEEEPFLRRDRGTGRISYVPRYEPTLDTDRKQGTRAAERKGPFPIGVAVEGKIPASWFDEAYDRETFAAAMLTPIDGVYAAALTAASARLERPVGRLIVFGSGNLFSGSKLDPPHEKLLVHSANWLTGRTDRLPHAELPPWQFPRVEMTSRQFYLWRYGTAIGLPLLAVYLGFMAMMIRRLR